MRSILSIKGLYNYDPDIFSEWMLPPGVDKETLVPNLLAECAELEVIYPDPRVMRSMIGFWSKTMQYKWSKLLATENFVYNPIWNKDGTVRETETRDLQHAETGKNTSTVSMETTGRTTQQEDQTTTTDVSAFDQSGYSNRDKVTSSDETSGSATTSGSSTNNGENNVSGTDTGTIVHERVESGNIGVTTTQQMITEERAVADFSVYAEIIRDFQNRFCLLVY